jgi:hypothetical protein
VAVPRGMAVGGDRNVISAAPRRPRSRSDQALADPGAVRSARGPRRDGTPSPVPDRCRPRVTPARHRALPADGRVVRWSPSSSARPAEYAGAQRLTELEPGLLQALGRHCTRTSAATHAGASLHLDLGGHPRGPAAPGQRHRDRAPAEGGAGANWIRANGDRRLEPTGGVRHGARLTAARQRSGRAETAISDVLRQLLGNELDTLLPGQQSVPMIEDHRSGGERAARCLRPLILDRSGDPAGGRQECRVRWFPEVFGLSSCRPVAGAIVWKDESLPALSLST